MDDIQWYERLAAVPGVRYEGYPNVDRRKLPQHNAKPSISRFEFDGQVHQSLLWTTRAGSTSQSPAAGWPGAGDSRKDTVAGRIRRVYEALELPGKVADYHFALLGTYEGLWTRRKREPELLPELEKILLLDISLVKAQPDRIAFDQQGEKVMPRVPAFHYLITLYEREGFLHEALEVASLAAMFGQGSEDEERVAARLAQLEAEDRS
jgi:hypothetical protein